MPANSSAAAVILAAGKGTRMKSELPKCLHSVCGLPMLEHVVRAVRGAGIDKVVVVVGHGHELVRIALGDAVDYAVQTEQLGTGHAALMAAEQCGPFGGPVYVQPGDAPLMTAEGIRALLHHHQESGASVTLGTCCMADPTGYGRLVRDASNRICRSVEQKDASAAELLINEVNTSFYCFDGGELGEMLPLLRAENSAGEYYLTDTVHLAYERGGKVESLVFPDDSNLRGINDRWQLAEASQILRMRILKRWAMEGVTIVDPATTFVGPDVVLEPDSMLEPCTMIAGECRIGSGARIGPYANLTDTSVGENSMVLMSQVHRATIGRGCRCGPFANLRPGSVLGDGVRIGNFVEVKNAQLGQGVSASHLSYIGDAEVGAKSNIGAGTITCNYDGFAKHRTTIGADVFVGSNSTLIAPLNIGDGSMIAAGSVIDDDVPAGAMAIGRGRQETKEEWAVRWRKKKQMEKS